mgnify:CR=1 FL=1
MVPTTPVLTHVVACDIFLNLRFCRDRHLGENRRRYDDNDIFFNVVCDIFVPEAAMCLETCRFRHYSLVPGSQRSPHPWRYELVGTLVGVGVNADGLLVGDHNVVLRLGLKAQ